MSDDKCPNCDGELISRVSFVDYCLDCDTTIDAAYWKTRADVAEKYAESRDAQVAALTAALQAANEDAALLDDVILAVEEFYAWYLSADAHQVIAQVVQRKTRIISLCEKAHDAHRARVGGGK